LGTLAAIGHERRSSGRQPGTIVLVGDGISVEPGRRGRGDIDFRRRRPASDEAERLSAFKPDLAPLRGARVIILGLGANTNLGPERVRHAEEALDSLLRSVGATFTATRSTNLPRGI
jgi:hypothetical protein